MIRRQGHLTLAAVLLATDIVLFIMALISGRIVYFYTAVFLLVFFVLEYAYLLLVMRGLRIARTHSPSVVEGEEFFIDMAVANFSRIPVFNLEVRDAFPPGRTLSINRILKRSILPRSVYEYTARAYVSRKMGTYNLGPVDLVLTDPFGIFTIRRRIEHFTELTVYPAIRIPDYASLMESPMIRRIGEEIVNQAGASADFRGQREYRRGDPKKTIHWPATARHQRLIVKEFDECGITDIAVFTDYRSVALRGTGNQTTIELGLKTAAAIVSAASRSYHRFAAAFVGKEHSVQLDFGNGVHHLHMVLQKMVTLGKPGRFNDYCRTVKEQLGLIRRNSTAVFICNQTATDPDELKDIIRTCRIAGVLPIVVLIHDRSFIKLYPEQLEIEQNAAPYSNAAALLEQAGARVYELNKKDDPAEIIDAAAEVNRWRRMKNVPHIQGKEGA